MTTPYVQAHFAAGDLDARLRRELANFNRLREHAHNSAIELDALQDAAMDAFGSASGSDAAKEVTLRALSGVRDAGRAAMIAHFPQLKGEKFIFDGREWTTPERPYECAHASGWRRGFLAAMVLRDDAGCGFFSEIPAKFLVNDRVLARPWVYEACNAYRGMFLDADGWQGALKQALDWARTDDAITDYGKRVLLPALAILDVVYKGVPAVYEAIERSLQSHKAYYSTRLGDPRGMVALETLAAAVWAHSCGSTTTVESDYIPRWLVVSDW